MNDKKIFYNGTIITINESQPFVDAVGIEGENIVATGTIETVKGIMGKDAQLVDLQGKTLLPGFIDSHLHPVGSLFYLIFLDLTDVKSIKELQELLKDNAEKKEPDELILGLNLDEQKFNPPILPTRWDLDQACSNNPCALLRHDAHLLVANSKALEAYNITPDTVTPEGGEIKKNEKGELTGILIENATSLIMSKIPPPDSVVINEAATKFSQNLAKNGITSVHGILELDREGGVENLGGVSIPIIKSVKSNILQNYYFIIYTQTPKKLKRLKKPPLDDGKKSGKFSVGGLKSWLDGTFGSSTAMMFENFTDQPDKNGFLVIDEDLLYKRMKNAHSLGLQIAIHAIGDRANRIVVDLYKRLLNEFPRDNHRHRIEHCSLLMEDVIKDVKELGLVLSCQPPFINSEYTWLERRIGKERCKYVYPYRSLVDAGVVVAAGSDCPVENPNPILGLDVLVNRNDFVPEQCIMIEEALKMYTKNGAYASFQEDVKGTIEVGKLADFVILDRNPLDTPKNEIKDLQVDMTIIRGQIVYQKEGK